MLKVNFMSRRISTAGCIPPNLSPVLEFLAAKAVQTRKSAVTSQLLRQTNPSIFCAHSPLRAAGSTIAPGQLSSTQHEELVRLKCARWSAPAARPRRKSLTVRCTRRGPRAAPRLEQTALVHADAARGAGAKWVARSVENAYPSNVCPVPLLMFRPVYTRRCTPTVNEACETAGWSTHTTRWLQRELKRVGRLQKGELAVLFSCVRHFASHTRMRLAFLS